jgi:hypothetical protein
VKALELTDSKVATETTVAIKERMAFSMFDTTKFSTMIHTWSLI